MNAGFGLTPPVALFYDTETTDLPLYGEKDAAGKPLKDGDGKLVYVRSADPRQPHLVQLAASVVDTATREVIASLFCYIKPDGWTSSPEALAKHGCTDEFLHANGIPEIEALQAFMDLWEGATYRVGHFENFDARIIRIGLARYEWDEATQTRWKEGMAVCTLQDARPIIKAATGNGKSPSLIDTHTFFKLGGIEDAHRADADRDACMRVFWAIADHNARGPAAVPNGAINVY